MYGLRIRTATTTPATQQLQNVGVFESALFVSLPLCHASTVSDELLENVMCPMLPFCCVDFDFVVLGCSLVYQ